MSIVILMFGIIGFSYLGVREYPSVDTPVISVVTNYPGANAEVIESQITEPLEGGPNPVGGLGHQVHQTIFHGGQALLDGI